METGTRFQFMVAALMVVWAGTGSARAFSGLGSGTEADPYIITNVQQLQEMQEDLGGYYVLGNDIDASETETWNEGAGFVPIEIFTGTLNGRGHVIDHLHVNRINKDKQGLFGTVWGGVLSDVHLTDSKVTGNLFVGMLAGAVGRESYVFRCSATGTVTLKKGSGDSKSGGLIGSVGSGTQVDQCFSGVNVHADKRIQVGGLVGYFAGRNYEPISILTNSYSFGTVKGTGSKQGNLLGDADGSRVDKCYSCGEGKALIGFNWKNPVITNCYWNKEDGASSSSRGGVGKTTEEMIQQSTFAGWDFDEIWVIDEGESYPYFKYLAMRETR